MSNERNGKRIEPSLPTDYKGKVDPSSLSGWELFFRFKEAEEIPQTTKIHHDYFKMLRQGQTAADLGCGTGRYAQIFSALGVITTGFDINPHAIAKAREDAKKNRINAIFDERDVTKLLHTGKLLKPPTSDQVYVAENMFDHVLLAGTTGVVELEISEEMDAQAYRLLKPGGTMVIGEHVVNSTQIAQYREDEKKTGVKYSRIVRNIDGTELWYVRHFKRRDLAGRLKKLGLTSIQIRQEWVTAEVIKGTGAKARLQCTVWGVKPFPVEHTERPPTKSGLPSIADLESGEVTLVDFEKLTRKNN